MRRLVFAFSITQIIAWGSMFYAIAVLGPSIRAELGLDKSGLFGIVSLTLLTLGLVAPTVGRMIDATGGRTVMTLGSALAALACTVLAAAPNAWVYGLGWMLGGIAMAMGLYDAAFATLNRHTGAEYRRALTLVTLAGGLASTVFWPLTMQLLGGLGWRGAFAVFALLHLGVCVPLHWWAIPAGGGERDEAVVPPDGAPPESPGAAPTTVAAFSAPNADTMVDADRATGARPGTVVPPARPAAVLRWLTVSFALGVFIGSTMSMHLLGLLQAQGMTLGEAVTVGACIGPMQLLGRLGELLLGARVHPTAVGTIALGLIVTGMAALMLVGGSLRIGILFAMVYGAGNGLMTIARGMVPAVLFGRGGHGARIGRIARWVFLANAAAPAAYAALLGAGVSYGASIFVLLALALLALGAYRRAIALARTPRAA